MPTYSIWIIPVSALDVSNGTNPFQGYNDPSGGSWNAGTTLSFNQSSAVEITVDDTNDNLDDDQWWQWGAGEGRGTQTIQTPGLSGTSNGSSKTVSVGDDITDEYELEFTATVDGLPVLDGNGDPVVYTIAVLNTIPGDVGWAGNGTYIGITFQGQWPPEGAVLSYTGTHHDNETLSTNDINAPCFTRGTLIATPDGEVAIETLSAGDLVLTRDHGAQPLRWTGSARLTARELAEKPKLLPIRIRAGALGAGTPRTDLVVSQQHRILLRSKIAERMFGAPEVLVAARQLLGIDGIDIVTEAQEVDYFHLLFDRHEILFSNGAETESLYTGAEALRSVSAEAREEIFALFPQLREHGHEARAARLLVRGRMARKCAERHSRNQKPLIAA